MTDQKEQDDPIAIVEARITSGKMELALVEHARNLWRTTLQQGITMPNGEHTFVSERDLHHLLADDRILRKPERIERVLRGVYELRSGHSGRRIGLSRWFEEGKPIYGYAILDADHLWTAHIADLRRLEKLAGRSKLLWKQEKHSPSGEDPNTIS